MQMQPAQEFGLLADAFCYPAPRQLLDLQKGVDNLAESSVKALLAAFVAQVGRLSPGEWEELYTRTLDLNPPAAPYIGFQIWGESYARGSFLAKLKRVWLETGIDAQGELPDHLIPVLRYLGQAAEPLPELVQALVPALQRMLAGLRGADPGNPYLNLIAAALSLSEANQKEPA